MANRASIGVVFVIILIYINGKDRSGICSYNRKISRPAKYSFSIIDKTARAQLFSLQLRIILKQIIKHILHRFTRHFAVMQVGLFKYR